MVAGHVGLDVSCLDRLYLNGYVNKLQTPGGVVYFFHDHRGKPIVSPALNRITGMPLACAQFLMSCRNFSPIGSNNAGDTIGLPR